MSDKPADATEQDSGGASSITVQRLTSGQVGIFVIQGFAILVAFTTLLGRLHFQAYSSTLRIPESEFHIDVLTYAVASPDVAILGFGVALFSVFAVILLNWRIGLKQHRWIILCGGLLLLATGSFRVLMDSLNDGIPESGIGLLGIWWLLVSASWAFGTAFTLSAVISWLIDTPIRDRRSRSDRRANKRSYRNWIDQAGRILAFASLYAAGLGMIVLILIITILQATAVGRMDASAQLRDAPLVELTTKSQTLSGTLTGHESALDTSQLDDSFQLVHVGDKFVYLRRPEFSCVCPEESGLNSGDPYQYAIPITEIASITQIVDPE